MLLTQIAPEINGVMHNFQTKSSMGGYGHNGGPEIDDESAKRPRYTIRTRWAKALFDDPDTPTYVIAMAWVIHWFSDKEGRGAAISNDQFADICNLSRPTITKGKEWLRQHGYVNLTVGDGRSVRTTFQMVVPNEPKGETALPLSEAAPQRKGVTALPLSYTEETPKGETTFPETSLPLSAKGETSLPPYSRDVVVSNIYNNNPTTKHAARAKDLAGQARLLCDELCEAHHPVIDPQRNYKLAEIGVISVWLELGCDPELDIKPTVKAMVSQKRGAVGSVASWKWFDGAVMQAMRSRTQMLAAAQEAPQAPAAPQAAAPAYKTARQQKVDAMSEARRIIERMKQKDAG